LDNPTQLADGLQSYVFCTGVGGIAFGGIAIGGDGLRAIGLTYDAQRPDRERLQVTLQDPAGARETVTAPIFDWQLVPIASFAAGTQHSCITLFGRLNDPDDEKARRDRGEKIVNYHTALVDTLLGLRLFQADILILHPDCCDLPKQGGKYVLGPGESPPDVAANLDRLANVHRLVDTLPGGPFQSYIICDHEQQASFRARGNQLVLTGDPMWHCWRTRTDDRQRLREIQDRANAEANRVVNAEMRRDGKRLSPGELRAKYTEGYQRQRHSEVWDKVVSEALLETMPEYSRRLSAEIRREGRVNPAVYDALVTMMRYAAFFRSVNQHSPEMYKAFVTSLAHVKIAPPVRTPTAVAGLP